MREAAVEAFDFQHVGEELASSKVLWATAWSAVGRAEDLFVVVADHRDAAAGGGDDVIVVAEDAEEALGERAGVGVQADVGHGLAAAGLLGGELDFTAEALEDP